MMRVGRLHLRGVGLDVWADGEMSYAALDAIGGSAIQSVLDSIRAGGRVLLYGVLGGPEVRFSDIKLISAVS